MNKRDQSPMRERMPYDGHRCPLAVTFDIAQEQMAQRGLIDEAALALRMPWACLAAARERYGCTGATESDGHAVCLLEVMSMHARSIAGQVIALAASDSDEQSSPVAEGGLPDGIRREAGPYL